MRAAIIAIQVRLDADRFMFLPQTIYVQLQSLDRASPLARYV